MFMPDVIIVVCNCGRSMLNDLLCEASTCCWHCHQYTLLPNNITCRVHSHVQLKLQVRLMFRCTSTEVHMHKELYAYVYMQRRSAEADALQLLVLV